MQVYDLSVTDPQEPFSYLKKPKDNTIYNCICLKKNDKTDFEGKICRIDQYDYVASEHKGSELLKPSIEIARELEGFIDRHYDISNTDTVKINNKIYAVLYLDFAPYRPIDVPEIPEKIAGYDVLVRGRYNSH